MSKTLYSSQIRDSQSELPNLMPLLWELSRTVGFRTTNLTKLGSLKPNGPTVRVHPESRTLQLHGHRCLFTPPPNIEMNKPRIKPKGVVHADIAERATARTSGAHRRGGEICSCLEPRTKTLSSRAVHAFWLLDVGFGSMDSHTLLLQYSMVENPEASAKPKAFDPSHLCSTSMAKH